MCREELTHTRFQCGCELVLLILWLHQRTHHRHRGIGTTCSLRSIDHALQAILIKPCQPPWQVAISVRLQRLSKALCLNSLESEGLRLHRLIKEATIHIVCLGYSRLLRCPDGLLLLLRLPLVCSTLRPLRLLLFLRLLRSRLVFGFLLP